MRKPLYVLASLLISATAAMAVGKVTVDPNVAGARANVEVPDVDARLNQKVSVDARRQTVSSILADLTKLTGVTLRAGYSDADWQVRDRRMNVFAKDTSLRSLMESIPHVMKFKWSRKEADGTWTYRLYMDRTTLLGAERQRLIEEERMRQLEDKQRERLLDDLTRADAMSDEELEGLRDSDPMLYVYTKIGWTALLPDLFAQAPGAKEAWMAGDSLTLQGTDVSPEAQAVMRRALQVMDGFFRKGDGNSPIPADVSEHMDQAKVVINNAKKWMAYRGDSFIGDVTISWPGGGINTGFMNPDSEVADSTARAYIRSLDGEPVDSEIRNETIMRAVQEQKTDFGEPIVEHPDDPALSAKVKLKPMGDTLADLLRAVSKASGHAVVSDCSATAYEAFDSLNTEIPLQTALSKISSQYRCNWDKQGGVLEFRDRDWFRKRTSQVPEAWLEPWRKALKSTGTLTLDQLSQMSLLGDEQAFGNLYSDDVLSAADGLMELLPTYGDLLRAYACLDDEQQAALSNDAGLDMGTVSQTQRDTVARVFMSKPLMDAGPDAGIVLSLRGTPTGKQVEYAAVATSADGKSAKWEFRTPKYQLSKVIAALPWAGEERRALELLGEAKKAGLTDVDAWFHLGMLLYDAKRYPAALEVFERSIALADKQPMNRFGALAWKGHVLDITGRREDAIGAYKDALKIDIGGQSARLDQYDMVIDRKWVEERLKTPFERK
jgi:tetratricopeptide (TPR) repeat protein